MNVVTTTDGLAVLCRQLATSTYVAVDTEFMREQTFWPKLCLVQLASPDAEAIVDPLAEGIDLAPFWELMTNRDVVKVFHAARQDLEIVHVATGTLPAPVFDTQVAAMVCGFGDSISYVNLVKRIAGQDLDKSSRFTDWSRRPLSQKQLLYALGDVTHLCKVYVSLKQTLEASGRAHWLDEEMATLLDPATYETLPEDAWRRLKLKVRSRKSLAVMIELAAWRERAAQSQDVPRSRIIRDEALYDIASQMPTETKQLAELRTLSDGFSRSARAREIVDAVNRGLARDPATLPAISQSSGASSDVNAMCDVLRVLLKATAQRHKVAPRLIADAEDIEAIASQREPDVPALKGWRRELFGEDALRLKRGELALTVRKGEVVAIPVPKDGGQG
ncbi:MAG: ribonuclease D [Hyphomicrobiaceae bacterium]